MSDVLVHVGYHKTGSNWLQRRLFSDPTTGFRWLGKKPRSHPVRRLVETRPLEFDASESRSAFEPLLAGARAAGLVPVVSLERLSGHPFSGGHDSKEIADRLRAVFVDARVLAVVREQRSIVLSVYKGYVATGGTATLRQFLEPPTTRSARVPAFDWRHFEYDRLIAYYRSVFGADRVLALPFERFVADGRAFVAAIGEFAGRPIPDDVLGRLPYARPEKGTRSALAVGAVRSLNRLAPRGELNPAPLVESAAAARLARAVQGSRLVRARPLRALAERSEASLRATIAEWAGDRYAESNRRLSELLGVDLRAYGWTA